MYSPIEQYKEKLLSILTIVAFVATALNVPIFYFLNPSYSYLLLAFALSYLFMSTLIKHHTFKHLTNTNILCLLLLLHMLTIPIMNSSDTFVISWIVLYPIVAFSLNNHRTGLLYSTIFLLLFFLLFFTSSFHESYTLLNVVMVGMMYLVLAIILFFIIQALGIKEKSLQQLNQTLEVRIKESVEEIHDKEKLLIQQSRLAQMGEVINMIGHQWRQPLATISSHIIGLQIKLQLDELHFENEETCEQSKSFMLQELQSMNTILQGLNITINNLRDFYKPNNKQIQIPLQSVTLQAVNIIRSSLENDHITIKEHYNSDEPIEIFDHQIMQVVLNILKNAQDHFKKSSIKTPLIQIFTTTHKIRIVDNGGGIPLDIIDKIFDPYFSTKSEKNGTGLGLYMSKIIIQENHNGELLVSNEDEGVCFTILL